jgi:hypothetical protein
MNTTEADKRKLVTEQLEIVRAKLRATGATVLSPTPEWVALRKEMMQLNRKLR